jgi:hypothetical protein
MPRRLCRRGCDLRPLGNKALSFRAVAIPHSYVMASTQNPPRHRFTHLAHTKKANLHRQYLSFGDLAKSLDASAVGFDEQSVSQKQTVAQTTESMETS